MSTNSPQERYRHIGSWRPFSEVIHKTFTVMLDWKDLQADNPLTILHARSVNLPIDFVGGYELIGRGIIVPKKHYEKYKERIIVRALIYPDPFYVAVISRPGDNFHYGPLSQSESNPAKEMILMGAHPNGYFFVKATQEHLKTLREKLTKLIPLFPPTSIEHPIETIEG